MEQSSVVEVTGLDGLRGTLDTSAATDAHAVLTLDDQTRVRVPMSMLQRQTERHYFIPLSRSQLTGSAESTPTPPVVVPVVREEARVAKREIETGRVRVRKLVREEEETFDEPLAREEVTVERVPVERFVEGPQPMRREGDVVVIPIVEEVLVVEKRLMLKEELRVRKQIVEIRDPQTVRLRREEAVVERLPPLETDEKARPDTPGGTNVAKGHPAD
jgi:uncharacterized protein (TIGR02271 family)